MKRKHHNAFKRCQQVFSNVRLWSWESMREDGVQIAHGMARIGFVWRDLDQRQVSSIVDKSNNWAIICRALCRFPGDTDDCIEQELISLPMVRVNDLQEQYRKMRAGVLASVNKRHVIDVGWIVQSYKDVTPVDDEYLPLFQKGRVSEERRNQWLLTDADINGELRNSV